jgi:hypothetical protein
VRRVLLQLNALCKTATLQFALSVGELVIETLYSGDISRFRLHHRKHHAALRKIAADPELAMSPSALYRSIAIYELCERLGVRSWKHVSTSHLRLVLALGADEQAHLLQEAETQRWPVRRLEEQVAALTRGRSPPPGRGGRRRRSRLRKTIDGLQRDLRAMTNLLESEENIEIECSPESVRAAIQALRSTVAVCAALENRILHVEVESETRPLLFR